MIVALFFIFSFDLSMTIEGNISHIHFSVNIWVSSSIVFYSADLGRLDLKKTKIIHNVGK